MYNRCLTFNAIILWTQGIIELLISFAENPIYEMKDYRLEMRVTVPSLRRLDKEVYTAQENEEADLLLEQQKQE